MKVRIIAMLAVCSVAGLALWARPRGATLATLDLELAIVGAPLESRAAGEQSAYRTRRDRQWFDFCGIDLRSRDCPMVGKASIVPTSDLEPALEAVDAVARDRGWQSTSQVPLDICTRSFAASGHWNYRLDCDRTYKSGKLYLEVSLPNSAEATDLHVPVVLRIGQ